MGAGHSRFYLFGSKRKSASVGNRSLCQEKHNSADSSTPLACHKSNSLLSSPPVSGRRRWTIAGNKTRNYDTSVFDTPSTSHSNRWSMCPVRDTRGRSSIDTIGGNSNVSKPLPPPRLHSLSELIDPATLPIDAHVRSPSGNLLAPEQFMFHPARPLSIRERQEEIRDRVRAASRLGEVHNVDEESKSDGPGSKWWVPRCRCFK